jgi:hypothetical protein
MANTIARQATTTGASTSGRGKGQRYRPARNQKNPERCAYTSLSFTTMITNDMECASPGEADQIPRPLTSIGLLALCTIGYTLWWWSIIQKVLPSPTQWSGDTR